jgi:hypothetical protein
MQEATPLSEPHKTECSDALCGQSGSSTDWSVRKRTPLTEGQQERVAKFINLAKSAAKELKDRLSAHYNLSDYDKEVIDGMALDLLIAKASETDDDQLVAGLFNQCFKNFVTWEQIKAPNKLNNRPSSLTKKDGTDRTDIIDSRSWLYGDVVDYVGCPHADIVRRHYVDGEPINTILKTKEERATWYRTQRPEVIAYLKKLYDR